MKIETTRFGEIEVEEAEFIVMKGPILGFEQLKRFTLLNNNSGIYPFMWLQSVDDPAVAFVVVSSGLAKPDYSPAFSPGSLALVEMSQGNASDLLLIVTVRSNPARATANLRAPLLLNAEKRLAAQVVLEDPDYPIQYELGG